MIDLRFSFVLTALTTAGLAVAQDAADDTAAATVRTGAVEAFWFTSHGRTPIARGSFELERGRGAFRLRIDLQGAGRFDWGCDADGAWAVDPLAGPVLLAAGSADGWRRVADLLCGQLAVPGDGTGPTLDGELDGREVRIARAASSRGTDDEWITTPEDGRLVVARVHVPNGLGGTETVELRPEAWRDAQPDAWALRIAHQEYVLRTTKRAVAERVTALAPRLREIARRIDRDRLDPSIEVRTLTETPTASVRAKVRTNELGKELATMLPEVMGAVYSQGAAPIAAPFSRYHAFGPAETDLEAGVAVSRGIAPNGRVTPGTLPACRAVTTWHVGPYHELAKAYARVEAWIAEQGLERAGASWEIYWTDPGLVPDPAQWRTQLFFPIR